MATDLEQKLEQILEEKNTKIKPENLKQGVSAFGIGGELKPLSVTNDATATNEDILLGKVAYVKSEKLSGTIPNNGKLNYIPSTEQQIIPEGYTIGGVIEGDSNLVAENIKKDVTIFGVQGSLEGGGESEYNVLLENSTATTFGLAGWVTKIASLDLSNVTSLNSSFKNCSKLMTLPNELNTSKVTNMYQTFYGCGQLTTTPKMDLTAVNGSAVQAFYGCTKIKNFGGYNTHNIKYMEEMFYKCWALEEIELDMSSCTSIPRIFYECTALKKATLTNTSKITQMQQAFSYCRALEEISEIDASECTTFSETFSYTNVLKKIIIKNTSKLTDVSSMFLYGMGLEEAPELDTSNVTNMKQMFFAATALTTIPEYDCSKVTNTYNTFLSCKSLENVGGFKNLGKAYTQQTTNYSNYTIKFIDSTNLTYQSLLNLLDGLYDLNLTYDVANGGTLYRQSCNIGATNLAKLQETEEGLQALADADAKGWNVS